MVVPNTVIAGSGRSGTTALFRYLSEHPDVCVSARKETNYFEYAFYGTPVPPLDEYTRYFAKCRNESIVLEASPGYLSDGCEVAREVNRVLGPRARVIVILREPVERLVSFYNHSLSHGRISPSDSFRDYVEMCRSRPGVRETKEYSSQVLEGYYGGFYLEPLREWFDVFDQRLKVLFYDELQASPLDLLCHLAEWLGIDTDVFLGQTFRPENVSHSYRLGILHKLARRVNQGAEPYMDQFPAATRLIRNAYLTLNTKSPSGGVDSELAKTLAEDYRDSNLAVGEFLKGRIEGSLPEWLS